MAGGSFSSAGPPIQEDVNPTLPLPSQASSQPTPLRLRERRRGGEKGLPSPGIDLPRCVWGGPAHHFINVELFLG